MTICQTLWTDKKNLLENNFGWLTPQYHLMAWALSALKLSQHYKTIHLYTDSVGEEILINQLGLPYTSVFNDYDDLGYPPYLWALPKLLTYAKQKQPFLHVDGDVMVWEPFRTELLSAELIVQNLEKGTEYYKDFFVPLCSQLKYLPSILKRNLTNNTRAYNAGIMGGSDLPFFNRFVSLALRFIEKNKNCKLNQNINMIFEQLLFFSLAKKEKKKVACLIGKTFNDNGYNYKDFADFPNAEKLGYLHLIGMHKSSKENCDWLARFLRQENEEVFFRIITLFKKQHYFYNSKFKEIYPIHELTKVSKFTFKKCLFFLKSLNSNLDFKSNLQLGRYINNCQSLLLKELFTYEKRISRICKKFKKIDFGLLKQLEEDSMKSVCFFSAEQRDRMNMLIYRNPYTEIIHSAFDWTDMQYTGMKSINIKCSDKRNIVIGVVPELFFSGYRELVLDDVCVNIIILSENKITCQSLLEKIRGLLPHCEDQEGEMELQDSILSKVIFLLKNKLLLTCS